MVPMFAFGNRLRGKQGQHSEIVSLARRVKIFIGLTAELAAQQEHDDNNHEQEADRAAAYVVNIRQNR